MPKVIRLAFVILLILAVIEGMYPPSKKFLPLGGGQLEQIAIVIVLVLVLLELWDLAFGSNNEKIK